MKTPHLARLAEEGVLFEWAYSVAPITLVAHTSMMTGQQPFEHGVRNNGIHYVSEGVETLAERLLERGYRTGAFVSASVLDRRYGLAQGFEVYDDDLSTGTERHPRMVADRPAEAVIDSATAWLDGLDRDEPYFLWVHLYDPHARYAPPEPFRSEYRGNLYNGEIAYMDSQIGRLLEHQQLNREDIWVSVLGDHGESLGEHGEQTHALLAYDSTLRVPWIVWAPDGPQGKRFAPPVSQVDLAPTLLDLLELDGADEMSGRSLLGPLSGRRAARPPIQYSETYLPFYTYGWSKLKVLRSGRWKYIDAPTPELYDLARDPAELTNVHDVWPDRSHDFQRELTELMAGGGDPDREASLALESDALEKLRSLGYLATGSSVVEVEQRGDPKDLVDIHAGLERARHLVRDGLVENAVFELEGVLDRDPSNLAALIDLANAWAEKGDLDKAVETAEKALALDPNYGRLHLLLASIEGRRGNHENALELVDVAIGLDPRSVEAKVRRALVLRQLDREGEMENEIRESLAEHPDHPGLLLLRAQLIELPRGMLAEAESTVRASLDVDPFQVNGWRTLGQTLERQGRPDEALDAYRAGLEKRGDNAELHGRIGRLLARQGADEAGFHLQEAIRLSSRNRPDLRLALGQWLDERGRGSAAEREFGRVQSGGSADPRAMNNRAVAALQQGRLEEAAAELQALIHQHPDHVDGLTNLAVLELRRKQWAEAERLSRRVVELAPDLPEAWTNLGYALDEQQRLDEASAALERALEIDPTYWQARYNLALVLKKSGDPQRAVSLLNEVLQQRPSFADTHLDLADLYRQELDDPTRAAEHLRSFLAMASDHPAQASARARLREIEGAQSTG